MTATAIAPERLPCVNLMGVDIHALDEQAATDLIMASVQDGHGGMGVTPNVDHLRLIRGGDPLRVAYECADVVLCDGMPLVWAARLQGTPLPARVAGSDLLWSLSAAAADAGKSVYLLGGRPGAAVETAVELARTSPDLRIAGTMSPPLDFEKDEVEFGRVVAAIAAVHPDIVFMGLGTPKQELLAVRMAELFPHVWFLGVGAAFDMASGQVARAPKWIRRLGLEWLFRLVQEPRRLFRRYIADGLPFVIVLFATAARVRLSRVSRRSL